MQSAEEPVQDQHSRARSSLDVREPFTGSAAALIQWSLSAPETAGAEAFAAAVAARAELACQREGVRLLVFPEMSGLWLLLAELTGQPPVAEAGEIPAPRRAVLRLLGGILANMLRRPRGLLGLPARRHGLYICPGSSLLPPFRREPGGRLRLIGRGLANTSCLIAPNGRILGFRRKLHLTPLERRAVIAGLFSVFGHDTSEPLGVPLTPLAGAAVALLGFLVMLRYREPEGSAPGEAGDGRG